MEKVYFSDPALNEVANQIAATPPGDMALHVVGAVAGLVAFWLAYRLLCWALRPVGWLFERAIQRGLNMFGIEG